MVCINRPKKFFVDFACRGKRNRSENHIIRQPPFGQSWLQKAQDLGLCQIDAGIRFHDQEWPFFPLCVPDADDGRKTHARTANGAVLDLDGTDPFAA